jgi:ubiquinone/menaquinone biosynthesis C-methylase UbiE
MNCDRLARSYRWLEYLRYGDALERCRSAMLDQIVDARKALVIGDGDGRFLTRLALQNRTVGIDAIDSSRRMIEIASERLMRSRCEDKVRISLRHCDIRITAPPDAGYDLVVTHFFFDVFSTHELKQVINRVARWTEPEACWVVSEFDLPASAWKRAQARFWLRTMYSFFRIATNLRNQELPCWRPLLREAGFVPRKQVCFKGGFIVSELWQRATESPAA